MQDFLLDTDGDLLLDETTGDFVLGESSEQHQNLLLKTTKGAWKENPEVGVGVVNYLEGEDAAGLYREIRNQFTKDGMTVIEIKIGEKIKVDAEY